MTGCLPSCDFYKYAIECDADVVANNEEDPRLNNTLLFQFYFKSAEHELKEQGRRTKCSDITDEEIIKHILQYHVYDINALIADIGGYEYLGLLFGQSIYGIYELMTLFCKGKKALRNAFLPE